MQKRVASYVHKCTCTLPKAASSKALMISEERFRLDIGDAAKEEEGMPLKLMWKMRNSLETLEEGYLRLV